MLLRTPYSRFDPRPLNEMGEVPSVLVVQNQRRHYGSAFSRSFAGPSKTRSISGASQPHGADARALTSVTTSLPRGEGRGGHGATTGLTGWLPSAWTGVSAGGAAGAARATATGG